MDEKPELQNGIGKDIAGASLYSIDKLGEVLKALTAEQVSAFEASMQGHIHHATLGPGTIVVCMPGFLMAERTLSTCATGLRKVFATTRTEVLRDIDQHRAKSSAVIDTICGMVEAVLAKRAE